jgi:hypothetical protein
MHNNDFIIEQIEKETGIILQQNWQEAFQDYINHLIQTNFEKLVFLLYRIDVNETKIKSLLQQKSNSSAAVITQAIIERLEEKKETRKKYCSNNNLSEEEKW